MVLNPTALAQTTRSSRTWQDARERVIQTYRAWIRAAPEIQTMYSLNIPAAAIRTKVRQEFERHRFVNQLPVVDSLIFRSHTEYQETLNYWKQTPHVMKYFRDREDPKVEVPRDFMQRFLEGRN